MEFDLGDKKENKKDNRTEVEVRASILEKRKSSAPLDEREQALILQEQTEERELRNREYGR